MTRHKNALADRRAYWEAASDGMAWLHWYGTAHGTKAAFDRINGMAVQLTHLGDPTPADQTDGASSGGTVMVTVPVLTLLGLDEEPGTLEGYGPISPEVARLKHRSQWRVTQEPDGILHWTSPGTRSYRADPANPMGPPRPRPPVAGPKTRKRPGDDSHLMPRPRPTRQPTPPAPGNPPF
ncbi:hypothetical protein C3B61_10945 [Cryobacterium zongtaii]|uniref:Uncharacterized protein n=1 Tax=Cryobacterium zongtaii TaxID=1259217 RepID=A0A2S3ZEN2_9MICO|nr:hypothetical protein [Cryobacterium zongtaii]POH64990.1 hypothetical protein C3B61_10945 [Cryobacterium zongtaii]